MAIDVLINPLRGRGLGSCDGLAEGVVEQDATAARALYQLCPAAHRTELQNHIELAGLCNVGSVFLKREDGRMGLGSFKALGAAHAIAKMAAQRCDPTDAEAMKSALTGEVFVCASAGNHGLSVAAGAPLFGAQAVVLLSDTVPQDFAERLEGKGARVIRAGTNYEESMEVSKRMAQDEGWFLLSDGSWEGYSTPARDVMEGYLIMGEEASNQMPAAPTHIFLQAGVGGLAAACCVTARRAWGDEVKIIIVEPEAAPALIESVRAGTSVDTEGPVSSMGRLDCKTPSHLALKYLAQEADVFVTLDDELVETSVNQLEKHGVGTTPSGGAGFAALHHLRHHEALGLSGESRVLCYISEGQG